MDGVQFKAELRAEQQNGRAVEQQSRSEQIRANRKVERARSGNIGNAEKGELG
jgi:hypothetical protein